METVQQFSRARLARDHRFDGLFFTAVKTTGIYCRPVCPARPPKEENVVYYQTAAGAAEAGYRPCLRCRPESAPGTPVWQGTEATVSRALSLIQGGALNKGSVDDLADRLGITDRYLRALFARHLGASPVAFAQTQRFLFAKQLLNETNLSITQIALASGFGSIRRFNSVFKKAYGQPPRTYQRNAAHQDKDSSEGAGSCRLILGYRPPYDWPTVLGFLRTRAIPNVEFVGAHHYARTFRLDDCRGRLTIHHLPDQNAFELTVQLDRIESLLAVVARVRRLLDLDADVQAIQKSLAADPILAPHIERFPGTRLPGAWDSFEFAVRAVLGQQISVKAATTIAGRIADRFGQPAQCDQRHLTRYFPTPQDMAAADLSNLGLTRKRTQTLANLVHVVATGELRLEVGVGLDAFIQNMCRQPGIGPWTAHYIAMRGLSEPDAFPDADLGIIKALSPPGQKLSPARIRAHAEAWRPWRAYAAMLLWQSLSPQAQSKEPESCTTN